MKYYQEVECGHCGAPRHVMEVKNPLRPEEFRLTEFTNFRDDELDQELGLWWRDSDFRVKLVHSSCLDCRMVY